MAITQAQLNDLYKLAVGMFDAAPGVTFIDAWAQSLTSGMTISDIYRALARSPEFESLDPAFARTTTNEQFANAYVDQLLGNTVSAPNRAIALNFVLGRLNNGMSRAETIQNAVEVLDAIASTDPNFGAAAQRFDNRVLVAAHFTEVVGVTTTDLSVLRNSIAGVTEDPNTVIRDGGPIPIPAQPFVLTTKPDTVLGTVFSDVIFGVIDAATPGNSTFTAADSVNGASSTSDTLRIVVTAGIGSLPSAQVTNVEEFFIRDLGVGGTYNFSLYDGETLVANDRSTAAVTLSDVAPGAAITIQGHGVTILGATTFTMANATAPITLNIDGKVTAGNITRNQSGAATVVINSMSSDNTVDTIDLDTGKALTGLTINARTGALTATLADDYAANAKLTITGSNTVDLLGAALSANFVDVDASAQTRGGTRVLLSANTTSFTGGSGNDVVAIDRAVVFDTTGKLTGGTGIDTLRVADQAQLTAGTAANITGFDVLRIADDNDNAPDRFDTSLPAGIVGVELDAISAGDAATLDSLNATRASAITIRGNQTAGPIFNVGGASTVGQLDTLGISINDGVTAKNTITAANLTAPGVETVSFTTSDNLTLESMTGLTGLTNISVTGPGNVSLTTGALALNANTTIDAAGVTGTVTIDAAAASGKGVAIIGSSPKANTLSGSAQDDVLSGGSANDTFKGGNGIDSISISQGGDDMINFEGIVVTANGDIVTGFTAGVFSPVNGVDRLEMADADATTAFSATSGKMQTTTAVPSAAGTFNTATNNILELAFELPGNSGPNDLDTPAALDGTALLAALGQTLSVSASANAGYVIAYQENKAYLYHLVEGIDPDAAVAAADLALVGRFDNVAVGAFDATNFVDAV
jgi:hypothetical protein